MPSFEINIRSTDDPSGIQSATQETLRYSDAVGKALAADKKRADNMAARSQVKQMTEAEKSAALAAYELATAQEKANMELANTGTRAGGASDTMVNIKNGWMEAAAVINVAQAAIQAGQQVYGETIGKMIEYGQQVRDITQLSGVSAEAASRVYQVADDLEIEYGQLATAMEQAAKKGFVPTIENLATLSDKYVALSTQQEKNKLVFDTLGRSGMELVNMLELGGDKLLELNGAVDENLILSGLSLEQLKELVKSQDDWNDAIDIQKLKIGAELRPVLQSFLDLNNSYMEINNEQELGWKRMIPIYGQVVSGIQLVKSAMGAHETQTKRIASAAEEASAALDDEKNSINALQSKKITVETEVKLTGNYYKDYMANFMATHPDFKPGAYRAAGGPVEKGKAYWVGEQGPEPFIPTEDGYIVSNREATGGLARGGDTIVNVNVSSIIPLTSQAEAEQMLIPIIQRALRKV